MRYPVDKLDSYDIEGKGFPDKVKTKVLACHIPPLTHLQDILGISLYVSVKSGYRSKEWEMRHGRSGRSQHTFSYLGAVDLTFEDFNGQKDKVISALSRHTNYTRVAIYDSFLHLDYKNPQSERWVYDKNWKRIKRLES